MKEVEVRTARRVALAVDPLAAGPLVEISEGDLEPVNIAELACEKPVLRTRVPKPALWVGDRPRAQGDAQFAGALPADRSEPRESLCASRRGQPSLARRGLP